MAEQQKKTRRLLICGGGAIGLMFASAIGGPDLEVVTVDKFPTDLINGVNAGKLQVYYTATKNTVAYPDLRVKMLDEYVDDDRFDAILVAVKSMFIKDALKQCIKYLKDDGFVITIQNGMGHLDTITEFVPSNRVLVGITMSAVTADTSSCTLSADPGDTPVYTATGEPSSSMTEVFGLISKYFNFFHLTPDIWRRIWIKMIMNCSYNCVSSMTRLPLGPLSDNDTAHALLTQVASVARAHGVDIPDSEAVMYVGKNNARMTTVRLHKTSMLQDVLANRPTEVHSGRRHGISTPVCDTLYRLIKLYETSLGCSLPSYDVVLNTDQ